MQLAHLLKADDRPVVGIEHEFIVWSRARNGGRAARRRDFRRAIHRLRLGRANLDPADPYSYRMSSGAAITCDQAEAEIACPPVAIEPGFAGVVERAAAAARRDLAARLPGRWWLEGISTHISVSMADELTDEVARKFARTFAPAMMLMLDGQAGLGLLVRPRPGRLEIGGWFLDGPQLRAALVFAVAAARRCAAAVDRGAELPATIDAHIEPAVARYGWYLDRRAFGGDLYSDGRSARLPLSRGGETAAGEHLRICWELVRPGVAGDLAPTELALVDEIVAGRSPLPCEATMPRNDADDRQTPAANPFASVHADRHRPGCEIAPVMLTWSTVVLVAADLEHSRRAFVAVPRRYLASFVDALDDGRLDMPIGRFIARPHLRRRRLMWLRDAGAPALWDALGVRLALVPPEPGLQTSAAAAA